MENKFNFSSQICTTREQSERLLALGLKKETADCYYWQETEPMYGEAVGIWNLETLDSKDNQEHFEYLDKNFGVCLADDEEHYFIPAWSLHRLLLIIPREVSIDGYIFPFRYDAVRHMNEADDMYEYITGVLERTIKEGYFNKEYLKK